MTTTAYDDLTVFYGDIHSHCHQVGYGYGSVDEAYRNARSQLDFASVTAHAHWPDLPVAYRAVINAGDGRNLRTRAAIECFVGQIDLAAVDGALGYRHAELFLGEL